MKHFRHGDRSEQYQFEKVTQTEEALYTEEMFTEDEEESAAHYLDEAHEALSRFYNKVHKRERGDATGGRRSKAWQ